LRNQPHTSIRTRKVAVLAADGARTRDIETIQGRLLAAGAIVEIVSVVLGPVQTDEGRPRDATKTFLTTDSVLYDALYVPGGADSVALLLATEQARLFIGDAFRHAKPIGATNEGVELLAAAELADIELASSPDQQSSDRGVVTAVAAEKGPLDRFATAFIEAIAQHRHFDRPKGQLQPALPKERQAP
jgi:catalase